MVRVWSAGEMAAFRWNLGICSPHVMAVILFFSTNKLSSVIAKGFFTVVSCCPFLPRSHCLQGDDFCASEGLIFTPQTLTVIVFPFSFS